MFVIWLHFDFWPLIFLRKSSRYFFTSKKKSGTEVGVTREVESREKTKRRKERKSKLLRKLNVYFETTVIHPGCWLDKQILC